MKQRYQWVEILFGKGEEAERLPLNRKSCLHPDACAMCKKRCGAKIMVH